MCCMDSHADSYIRIIQWHKSVVWDHMMYWLVPLLRNVNSARTSPDCEFDGELFIIFTRVYFYFYFYDDQHDMIILKRALVFFCFFFLVIFGPFVIVLLAKLEVDDDNSLAPNNSLVHCSKLFRMIIEEEEKKQLWILTTVRNRKTQDLKDLNSKIQKSDLLESQQKSVGIITANSWMLTLLLERRPPAKV